MNLDDLIAAKQKEMQELQAQRDSVEKQIALLQQRREALILASYRVDGALEVLTAMKDREPATPEPEPPA